MTLQPGVELLAEGTEDHIGFLPPDAPALNPDDEVVYQVNGDAAVVYKIEKVRYTAVATNTPTTGPSRYSVYGKTDYLVSVVP